MVVMRYGGREGGREVVWMDEYRSRKEGRKARSIVDGGHYQSEEFFFLKKLLFSLFF
jgi:hypothetical protein